VAVYAIAVFAARNQSAAGVVGTEPPHRPAIGPGNRSEVRLMHHQRIWAKVTVGVACVLLGLSAPLASANAPSDQAAKAEILAHIHSIFQAFIDQDRDKIRATHSADWTGFQTGARQITKGVDAYMANVRFTNPMQRYEIEDYDIQVHGDIAVVYYVAHWWSYIPSIEQYLKMRARSVDIYRKDNGEWIQAGSNIDIMRRPGALQHDASLEVFDMELADELPD
jgi:ketosteroid isomerase-like protein